ncbi:hypothetical protein THAOC_06125 [Thalassiosira oceanica]|uniref:Uncharacterized protein n=1 Tax=Thalassiosira oceanica TaxID=159749 RepID=K0TM26_THAOC|nr:hypothetical protein THAOC_06125 [Thalassiosira oceanica]|eukprot:EJK72352.1 hypothetical protein THAOC_06125 [Thalassiosira oceanica]
MFQPVSSRMVRLNQAQVRTVDVRWNLRSARDLQFRETCRPLAHENRPLPSCRMENVSARTSEAEVSRPFWDIYLFDADSVCRAAEIVRGGVLVSRPIQAPPKRSKLYDICTSLGFPAKTTLKTVHQVSSSQRSMILDGHATTVGHATQIALPHQEHYTLPDLVARREPSNRPKRQKPHSSTAQCNTKRSPQQTKSDTPKLSRERGSIVADSPRD